MGLELSPSSSFIPVTEITGGGRQPPEAREVIQFDGVIVVGGRIAGAIAAYNLARHGIKVLCLDKENILEETYPSCSGCGGLKQAKTVELLASIGITLPEKIIRQRLDGYIVLLPHGGILNIPTPGLLAVDRGFGPVRGDKRQGLDAFLLQKAIDAGAKFEVAKVEKIDLGQNGKAAVTTANRKYFANFVMGAFGHSPIQNAITVPEGFNLDSPQIQVSSVHEFVVGDKFYEENYGSKVRVVVVPMHSDSQSDSQNVWFAAFVPKERGRVSMILMGKQDVTSHDVDRFMSSPYVHGLLPESMLGEDKLWKKMADQGGCLQCQCLKNTITTKSPQHFAVPIKGGLINIGDSGVTRLYKDGIGAAAHNAILATEAYLTGDINSYIAQANTYYPPNDDHYARLLMETNDLVIRHPLSEKALVFVNKHKIPVVTRLMNDHTRHMLTADIPYSQILPPLVFKALELAFPL